MSAFDITKSRDHFPALNQSQVFFDNAGGSQTLGTVVDSIFQYLSKTNVQLGASYNVARKSTGEYAAGYKAAAEYINAPEDNIVLGSSTTQLFRNLSTALSFPAGSEVIISGIDHEANIAPWVSLANSQNLTIKWWLPKSKENPTLLPSDLKELVSDKTVLVTATHVSNILGTIHDIKGIAEVVHTVKGALFVVDGVAYAPHRAIDVQDLGVDFYSFSWYKVYGPHISILYASPAGLVATKSLGHYFNPSSTLQDKLGLAGASYELVAAIPSVVSYLGYATSSSWSQIEEHEYKLQDILLKYLNSKPFITVIGDKYSDTKKRVATIAFWIQGRSSKEIVEEVEKISKGELGMKYGANYSNRLVYDFLGLEKEGGVVRVSMVHYNTVEEVNRLIEVFDQVL